MSSLASCVVCSRPVTQRQYALECDFCQRWCHVVRCQSGMHISVIEQQFMQYKHKRVPVGIYANGLCPCIVYIYRPTKVVSSQKFLTSIYVTVIHSPVVNIFCTFSKMLMPLFQIQFPSLYAMFLIAAN